MEPFNLIVEPFCFPDMTRALRKRIEHLEIQTEKFEENARVAAEENNHGLSESLMDYSRVLRIRAEDLEEKLDQLHRHINAESAKNENV